MLHLHLEITDYRPEEMRVIEENGWFLVQAFSAVVNEWITNAEWRSLDKAIEDCKNWYPAPATETEFTQGQEIKIDYITYIVEAVRTIAEVEATHPNTAREMKKRSMTAKLVIRKPKGKKLYMVNAIGSDKFTKPCVA